MKGSVPSIFLVPATALPILLTLAKYISCTPRVNCSCCFDKKTTSQDSNSTHILTKLGSYSKTVPVKDYRSVFDDSSNSCLPKLTVPYLQRTG